MLLLLGLLAKIGVFAAIGKFIDLCLSDETDKRLRGYLETYWLKLSFMSFTALGRTELQSALALSDQFLGKSLFSLRRLLASATLLFGCLLFAFVLGVVTKLPGVFLQTWVPWYEAVAAIPGFFVDTLFNYMFAIIVLPLLVSICLAFSITRQATALVLRVDDARLKWAFLALLAFHVILFLIWSPLVEIVQNYFAIVGRRLDEAMKWLVPGAKNAIDPISMWRSVFEQFLASVLWWDFWDITEAAASPVTFTPIFNLGDPSPEWPSRTLFTMAALISYVTYGWRIGFTLVFLVSYLAGPFFQRPLLKYGEEVIEKKKPLFTPLFTGIGVLFAGLSEAIKFLAHVST
jgi:hypothetical protein